MVALSFSLLYAAHQTLGQKCDLALYYERNYMILKNATTTTQMDVVENTFKSLNNRRNDHYIVSFVLDITAASFLIASAYCFRYRF